MADRDEQKALRYSAFISYSHHDSAFARRLHRKLENYRLPRRIAERQGERGAAARRLRPIFRDREELPAAPDLTQAVQLAISESSYLIVICSQYSSTSAWVAREIELFRKVHGNGGVLAALVDGATDEDLRSLFRGGEGSRCLEPLAADFRRQGDGGRLALLKLVAALAGVRLDALVQRDAQRRVRQATTVGASALLGMTAMGILALIAINARNATERERARGAALIDYSLSNVRDHLKSVGRLDVLNLVNQGALQYYAGQDLSGLPAQALVERAKLLQAIGEDDARQAKYEAASSQFVEAERTTAALLMEKPTDEKRIFAHAQSEYWLGFVSWRLEDFSKAQLYFQAYADLTNKLVQISPTNPDWLVELGDAHSNLGMFLIRQFGDIEGAEVHFGQALSEFKGAAYRRSGDANIDLAIADSYGWLGDAERLRGNCEIALLDRGKAMSLIENLLKNDRQNVEYRSEWIFNELALARIEICGNRPAMALDDLQRGSTEAEALATVEPQDADIRCELRMFKLFDARALMMAQAQMHQNDHLIGSLLGDCHKDGQSSADQELHAFCVILQARRFKLAGDENSADRWIQLAQADGNTRKYKLSSRWGLDFKSELNLVSSMR